MPASWRSLRVELRGGGLVYKVNVSAARRALAHPRSAWRAGRYTWRVVAVNGTGRTVASPWHSYVLKPRVAVKVSSGRLTRSGKSLKLRINYAAMGSTAKLRIRVVSHGRTVHSGRSATHREHARHGSGFPRRGAFTYSAALRTRLAIGSRISIYVTISSGGASHTYRVAARVR